MHSESRTKPIKVLLVDDSPIALKVLERILSSAPDIRVVGAVKNGKEGLKVIPVLEPDVICTDLHMPVMDGIEFTKKVMDRHPRPILVVSVSVREGSQNVFNLLEAGAVDVLLKPRGGIESEFNRVSLELVSKVRMLSRVKVFKRPGSFADSGLQIEDSKKRAEAKIKVPKSLIEGVGIIAIGASTGGPQALHLILSRLPANYPLPVVCIQHIGDDFADGLVGWLASECRTRVKFAKIGELPEGGTIYFPQPGSHLKLDDSGRFIFTAAPPCDGHRPSVTVTFRSLSERYGNRIMGILLTGMGRDGAEGMQAISLAGGVTIAQDEESSVVFGMPKAAIELGAAKYVMRLEQIVRVLLQKT